MRTILILISSCLFLLNVSAQTDSSVVKKDSPKTATHYDSLYMAKLNNSGNLMIAGGVGLFGAAGYLLYQGIKTYNAKAEPHSVDPSGDEWRNRKQGTIYYAVTGVAMAGGAVLIGLGARNKVDFKTRKKMLEMQSGILDNGSLGLALNF